MLSQNPARGKPQATAASAPIYLPGQATPVAFVKGRTLTKGIRPAHFLTRPAGAISFADTVLSEALRLGATQIRVTDRERGTVYRCSMEDFLRYRLPVARGFGLQWALERGRWSIDGAQPELEARDAADAARKSQLSLFGGAE